MSKLIHSKTFRSNLLKWFFTYLVVLLATTSVITYSRYISDMQGTGLARTAKFNVDIKDEKVCVADTDTCDLEKYKPYDDLEYYFTVDTSEIEVTTLILTRIKADLNHFNFEELSYTEDDVVTSINIDSVLNEDNEIEITETIQPNQGYVRIYKLKVSYKANNATETAEYENAVIAYYYATQVD